MMARQGISEWASLVCSDTRRFADDLDMPFDGAAQHAIGQIVLIRLAANELLHHNPVGTS